MLTVKVLGFEKYDKELVEDIRKELINLVKDYTEYDNFVLTCTLKLKK